MSDNVSQKEEVRSVLMQIKDSLKILDKTLESLAEKESDLMARTLQIREIPSVTKTAVGEVLSSAVPEFSQSVTETVIDDLTNNMDDLKKKMEDVLWLVKESKDRLQVLNFWTRKTVIIVLATTFFTAFAGTFVASCYMMLKNPSVYASVLRYLDTANTIEKERAQRNGKR